ncbi:hypothetical protein [Demequina gelatinilytica]|uniref:hypothetical protein n=1 Tax=Demequina gelatinilytica TaxID=1638980 RepID=UPI000780259B|nr:hypothetical protein [Demequina gelatinilytica]
MTEFGAPGAAQQPDPSAAQAAPPAPYEPQPYDAPPAQPQGFAPYEEPSAQGSVGMGLLVGAGLGAAAASVYALAAVMSGREFLFLAVIIGVAVAWGIQRFAQRRSIALGLAAVGITALLFVVAAFGEVAGMIAKEFDVPFSDALDLVLELPGDVISTLFDELLDYVWIGVTLGYAFFRGAGLTGTKAA